MEFALVIALAIEALAPPGGTASCPMLVTVFGPVCVVLQFCANAPEPVEITTAKANPARIPPSRAFNLRFMETAPEMFNPEKIKLQ